MRPAFEYCVCHVQSDRVTFVNGEWIGSQPMNAENANESLPHCPTTWAYLAAAGAEGWELVNVAVQAHVQGQQAMVLFLKRES